MVDSESDGDLSIVVRRAGSTTILLSMSAQRLDEVDRGPDAKGFFLRGIGSLIQYRRKKNPGAYHFAKVRSQLTKWI